MADSELEYELAHCYDIRGWTGQTKGGPLEVCEDEVVRSEANKDTIFGSEAYPLWLHFSREDVISRTVSVQPALKPLG